MTRADLHNTQGFHAPSLLAAAVHLQVEIPRKPVAHEPTSLIRNEGYMNGYLDAIRDLKAAAGQKAPEIEKKTFQPYSQQENQNRP
jgi:hypothetical protein